MKPDRWDLIQRIFHEACSLAPDQRIDFVARESGDDEQIRDEVERMLENVDRAGALLVPPERRTLKAEGATGEGMPAGLSPGRLIGDFELLKELGRGGMGVVFLAKQLSLDRLVALKLLPIHMMTAASDVERFRREGLSAGKLDHPALVSVISVGQEEDAHFIAMEYLVGGDLTTELSRQKERTRRGGAHSLPAPGEKGHIASCASLIAEVAEGLQYAHDQGLIHRDVKPSNLLISRENRLKLSDFGLARDDSMGSITQSNALLGTPDYMSPEQAAMSQARVDHRTDVYSLGVVLYEMLTLRRPFQGDSNVEIMSKVLNMDAVAPRRLNKRIPNDLEIICNCAMAKQVGQRYQSALAFADDLKRFLAHESIVARRPTLLDRAMRHVLQFRALYLGTALVLATALVTILVGHRMAQSRSVRVDLEECLAFREQRDWLSVPFRELTRFQERLASVSSKSAYLDGSQREAVTSLEQDLEQHRTSRLELGARLVDEGFRTPRGIEAFDANQVIRGLLLMTQARQLGSMTWMDPEQSLRDLLPRVSVFAESSDGAPVSASGFIRELDAVTGVPGRLTELGLLPAEGHALDPGLYRITVVGDDRVPREFTRVVTRGDRAIEIRCRIRQEQRRTEGMALVDGGILRLPEEFGSTSCSYAGTGVAIPDFYVDLCPVSVGQYRKYMESEGLGRPAFWSLLESDPEDPWPLLMAGDFDDHPMTGVSWYEARSYAEWRGKRLLSAPERDWVARGTSGRLFPYVVAEGDDVYRGVCDGQEYQGGFPLGMARAYLAWSGPVVGPEEARSAPYGLHHLLGNAWEWTESLGVELREGSYVSDHLQRTIMGCAWYARQHGADLRSRGSRGPHGSNAVPDLGFRCAVSVVP